MADPRPAVRERPIIFSAAMVRALLAGCKTQTRRVVAAPVVSGGTLIGWQSRGQTRSVTDTPYGSKGDRLWVKETWMTVPAGYRYRADLPGAGDGSVRWKSALFMPRKASRLLLEITAVRAERLHDLSETDARAEGVEPDGQGSCRARYAALWDELNRARGYGWSVNPWVWVVELRPVRDSHPVTGAEMQL